VHDPPLAGKKEASVRDLTKSMMSFSWAMSLFGVEQIANLLAPRDMSRPWGRAAEGFEAVTRATGGQLSDTLRGTFEAGDRMGRSMVDAMFGFGGFDWLNPTQWLQMSTDVMQRSAQSMGQMVPGGQAMGQAMGSAVQSATAAAQSAMTPIAGSPSGTSTGWAPPPGRSL
jgi:hypothetical protein